MTEEQRAESLASIRRNIEDCEEDLDIFRRTEAALLTNDFEAAIAAFTDALKISLLRQARAAKAAPVSAPTQGKAEA